MRKTINISGQDLEIESNALLPRQYRKEFGRDLMVDMRRLHDRYKADKDDFDPEIIENITWLMLRAAGNDVGGSVEEWLGGLDDILGVYLAMPEVIELWNSSQKTTSKHKKK